MNASIRSHWASVSTRSRDIPAANQPATHVLRRHALGALPGHLKDQVHLDRAGGPVPGDLERLGRDGGHLVGEAAAVVHLHADAHGADRAMALGAEGIRYFRYRRAIPAGARWRSWTGASSPPGWRT